MKYQFLSLSLYRLIILLLLIVTIPSCKDDPITPPPPPPVIPKDTINISIADYTHRSISINIKSTENNPSSTLRLYRIFNSSETLLSEYPIIVNDTTIIDDDNGTGLLLNTEYFYYAVRIDTTGERKDSSNLVQAATLDTTSHNYTWQEWVIGDWQSSLYDVWGTDENNVWACGTVMINDTTAYGVVKWNGSEWIPQKRVGEVHAIFGFSNTDIWAMGGAVEYYNGIEWKRIDVKINNGNVTILDSVLFYNHPYTSLWGTSSNNMYFGTLWGKIIHWNGSKATDLGKISEYIISGITGSSSSNIYITASKNWDDTPCELFHFNSSSFTLIKKGNHDPKPYELRGPFQSVWTYDGTEIYIPGNFINIYRGGEWSTYHPDFFSESLKGNRPNNIFVTGHFGGVAHFNGKTWHRYYNVFNSSTILEGIQVFEHSVFIVGLNGSQAFIYKGTSQ